MKTSVRKTGVIWNSLDTERRYETLAILYLLAALTSKQKVDNFTTPQSRISNLKSQISNFFMGRRSVRKPDPQLDLSRYLLEIEQLGKPLDIAALFGRTAPLEIEVGSGKGLFLQTAAKGHPETNYLGIELAAKYARHAAGRLAKYQLTNGKLIAGDALRVFREHLVDGCADAVHVYFPDPWWKKRHKKRRVMTAEFIRDIHRVLKPCGTLHFWTDVEEYFQTTLELIAAESKFSAPITVSESAAEHDLDYRTHFERRMRMHELPVYRSQYRKLA